jgi:glycosyltransferase involved in cell wall biosynthesis
VAERQVRILYIVTAFPRWPGDVITPWLTETIDRLRARGIEVEVLAPSYSGLGDHVARDTVVHRFRYAPARFETLTHDQTAPDRIRERPYLISLLPAYVTAGSIAAVRLTRRHRFDCVHAFWPIPHGMLGLAARRFSHTPLISTFFGVELTWLRRQFPILAPIARRVIRQSDAVTVISTHTAREVRRLVPDARIRKIPFGAAVAPSPTHEAPNSQPSPPQREFRLLFVGRLVERKGVSVLLRAFARVRSRQSDVHLTIVGDGPLGEPLRAEAERLGVADGVEFTGFVPERALSAQFERCDTFVLPAVQDSKGDVEGLGVVLLEAMLHDRPVIASDSGGIGDIVIDGETGLLTDSGDIDSLVAAILRMKTDAQLRDRLVRGARAHVERHFSWDRIITDLTDLYTEVTAPAFRKRRVAAADRG